jgi:hypothetical protein
MRWKMGAVLGGVAGTIHVTRPLTEAFHEADCKHSAMPSTFDFARSA